ncbi:M18 family aminopeptidase [Methylotetracoccus oryzae]|uniref:M18 family aminopeptidase n=1 Tax=Methylotetracoccus oryzae TaxID=1919059 RepID=UPI00111B75AD|nr:M18 family aminopeptidase [Methylotetracoccus oryzae]
MIITPDVRAHAQALLDFIDASPSPWHAVAVMARALEAAGFRELDEAQTWSLAPGARHYVIRGGSSLVAFIAGLQPVEEAGFRIVGAHTDSPGLRVKPRPADTAGRLIRVGVEVYGGPILATFADRDLGLAGRVSLRSAQGVETRLVLLDRPLLRLPNLAIHMNRKVNEDGLKFNRQTELPLLLTSVGDAPADDVFLRLLGAAAGCSAGDILGVELNAFDTQRGAFWGANEEFIANSQLDNLASCHAGFVALMGAAPSPVTCVGAFFDHEEIGSESAKGAAGSLLSDVLERIVQAGGGSREGLRRGLARSLMISADMAHAFQPNFPGAYEPGHLVAVNAGPVIKSNVNQRYATDGVGAARFAHLCERAGVPYQMYCHRSDLACGSTIGPMTAARLGLDVIDVGNPMWAMHSIRESAGVLDHAYLLRVLHEFFAG